jgi:Protein of unknown function with PCYCGC motif
MIRKLQLILPIALLATVALLFLLVSDSRLFLTGALAAAQEPNANSGAYSDSRKNSPYHKHPPRSALPATLDPAEFADNRKAYVAYTLAQRIPELLYQEPCFCGCRTSVDHHSLLDCYTNRHAKFCGLCQTEVIFCYEQNKLHQSPGHIRKAMLGNRWGGLDLEAYVRNFEAAPTAAK